MKILIIIAGIVGIMILSYISATIVTVYTIFMFGDITSSDKKFMTGLKLVLYYVLYVIAIPAFAISHCKCKIESLFNK